jgi:hypothetical protein
MHSYIFGLIETPKCSSDLNLNKKAGLSIEMTRDIVLLTMRDGQNKYEDTSLDDERLLEAELQRRGVRVQWKAWGQGIDQDGSCIYVIRSTWDYPLDCEAFLSYLRRIESKRESNVILLNSLVAVEWNSNKAVYLPRLRDEFQVDIVPTEIAVANKASLPDLLQRNEQDYAVVLKLAITNSGTGLVVVPARSAVPAESLHGGAAYLVQPLLDSIFTHGEISTMFFNGEFSHAVLKRPPTRTNSNREKLEVRCHEEEGGTTQPYHIPADSNLLVNANRLIDILRSLFGARGIVFVRLDYMFIDGRYFLSEVELIEPSMYLVHSADAPRRFADAILHFAK